MPPILNSPPKEICILRLSAVGDICHALPVVRTLQAAWPTTRITWVIGKLEYSLVGDIPGIEFIIFDKSAGMRAYRALRLQMRGRHFEVLLHMQMSLRASLASLLIPARIRLGFDKRRARDLQWLFTNRRIANQQRQHVLESFFEFSRALGVHDTQLNWDIPIPAEVQASIRAQLPKQPFLIISPCSSMTYRNWHAAGYAALANYAAEKYQLAIVLTGGPSNIEQQMGEDIKRLCHHGVHNFIGNTTLKQLLALLHDAHCVLSPDSGPAHMATAVGTPVIGLYAATNPARARPYLSACYVVDGYTQALEEKYAKPVDQLPWGIRLRDPGSMARLSITQVSTSLDRLMADHPLTK